MRIHYFFFFCLLALFASCSQVDIPFVDQLNNGELPTSITIVTPNEIKLAVGEIRKVEFVTLPEKDYPDSIFCLHSDKSSKERGYEIRKIENVKDSLGGTIPGRYIAYIADKKTFSDYDDKVSIVVSQKYTPTYNAYSNPVRVCSSSNRVLPVVVIETPDWTEITSKTKYVENTLMSIYNTDGRMIFDGLTNIKGRGNSTWVKPKKPYAIKFDKKQSLMSFPKDKSWVLLANYLDHTFMRNDLAFFMGEKISNLEWTPRYKFVDLTLNGQYKGIYQLGEKIKIADDRVNIGKDGILMEIDFRCLKESDARYFYVNHIECPVNIKDPDVEYNDDIFNYAKEFVSVVDSILFSKDFKNPENGWQKYLDMDSFVEWYIINEIAKNADSQFGTSCYMNLKRNGKLKMGPVWDFDLGFGNYENGKSSLIYNQTDGFYIKSVPWYNRLFEDPKFVSRVKERFAVYYSQKEFIMSYIDDQAKSLADRAVYDNIKWGTNGSINASDEEIKQTYQEKVNKLKNWLSDRLEWLNIYINEL